jgi:hypothetical protein
MPIPKSKYSEPRHTPGNEFTLNNQEYRGWYVVTFQDKYYTGKEVSSTSKEIFPIINQKIGQSLFTEDLITPSNTDRKKGILIRYIVQKVSNRKIIEVTKEKYNSFKDSSGYRRTSINWIIKGPAENIIFNSYPYYGADHRNKETVARLEQNFPGITSFFKNYSEFVE